MLARLTLMAEGFHLTGDVNFKSVVKLRKQGQQLINELTVPTIAINLEQVVCQDNAILPLLTAWQRFAVKSGKTIKYIKLPNQLKRLVALCKLTEVLCVS